MIINTCKFLEPLGRGSIGEVWRVEYCRPGALMGRFLAAKISYLPGDHEDIAQEIGLLRQLLCGVCHGLGPGK